MHSRPGKISAISDAGDGNHTRISITHGKKKKDKGSGDLVGYHRHTSDITIPTAHAKNYAIGQSVHAGIRAGATVDNEMNAQDGAVSEAVAVPGKKAPIVAPSGKVKERAKSKFAAALKKK